jgi:hypothetical protein
MPTQRAVFGRPAHAERPSLPVSGDAIVTDAKPLPTTKSQCRNGNWRTYGVFRNQGECVSFVATKGKNPPSGP